MGKSCDQIEEQLVSCLKKEDCVKSGNPTRYCLKNYLISDSCMKLHTAFVYCRKDQLNMRARIRGPKAY